MATASSFLQNVFGRCTGPTISLCGQDQQSSTEVLVSHRFDRPNRCIIEPQQVVRMMKYQCDELVRQEHAQNTTGGVDTPPLHTLSKDSQTDSETWEVESSLYGTEFSFAKTDITTATGATPVVANRDRYAPPSSKKHRSKAEQFKVMEAIKGTGFKIGSLQNMFYDDDSSGNSVASIVAESDNKVDKQIKKNDLPPGVQLINGGCGPFLATCAADELAELRREYGRALHLKLKANMGPFYWGPYLRAFPESPVPESLDLARPSTLRGLSHSWTENSSVGFNVNYGDYVHSSPIQMMVDDSDFMDLGMTGSLGLVKRFEVSHSGQRLKSPNHYKVLLNRRSGVPLAVCAMKSPYGSPIVRIYTVKQRTFSQRPAATTRNLGLTWCDNYPLYAFAEFTAEGEFPLPVRYSLYMSSGFDGCFEQDPSYRAFHRTIGSPEIVVMGRTETERERQGCAVFSLQAAPEEDYFAVSVSRGIDPALMICLASIIDETMENSIRLQCNLAKTNKKLKNGITSLRRSRPAEF
jgi:hypothetical protein